MNNDVLVAPDFANLLINFAIELNLKLVSPARIDGSCNYDFSSFAQKSQKLTSTGKFVFEVELTANKIEIAKAVEKMYGVTVTDVNTVRQIGKKKSRMTRSRASSGMTSTFKKAVVTLKDGDLIDFYENL
jgi:large subunit ribosomal protein L23